MALLWIRSILRCTAFAFSSCMRVQSACIWSRIKGKSRSLISYVPLGLYSRYSCTKRRIPRALLSWPEQKMVDLRDSDERSKPLKARLRYLPANCAWRCFMYLLALRRKLALSLFLLSDIPVGCKGNKQKVRRGLHERDAPSHSFRYSYALISKLAQHCERRPFLLRNFSCLR